jgi:hypothetical protein
VVEIRRKGFAEFRKLKSRNNKLPEPAKMWKGKGISHSHKIRWQTVSSLLFSEI